MRVIELLKLAICIDGYDQQLMTEGWLVDRMTNNRPSALMGLIILQILLDIGQDLNLKIHVLPLQRWNSV